MILIYNLGICIDIIWNCLIHIYYRNISNPYFYYIIIYLLLINLDTINSKVFFNQVQISINTLVIIVIFTINNMYSITRHRINNLILQNNNNKKKNSKMMKKKYIIYISYIYIPVDPYVMNETSYKTFLIHSFLSFIDPNSYIILITYHNKYKYLSTNCIISSW